MSELKTNVVMTGGPHPSSIRIKVGDTKMLGVHSISFDPIDKGQMATVTIKCIVRFGEEVEVKKEANSAIALCKFVEGL